MKNYINKNPSIKLYEHILKDLCSVINSRKSFPVGFVSVINEYIEHPERFIANADEEYKYKRLNTDYLSYLMNLKFNHMDPVTSKELFFDTINKLNNNVYYNKSSVEQNFYPWVMEAINSNNKLIFDEFLSRGFLSNNEIKQAVFVKYLNYAAKEDTDYYFNELLNLFTANQIVNDKGIILAECIRNSDFLKPGLSFTQNHVIDIIKKNPSEFIKLKSKIVKHLVRLNAYYFSNEISNEIMDKLFLAFEESEVLKANTLTGDYQSRNIKKSKGGL